MLILTVENVSFVLETRSALRLTVMRYFFLILVLILLDLFPCFGAGKILTIEIDDVIHPVTAEYIIQGIEEANKRGADAIILRLSTPGGLMDSTREIIENILQSNTPIITFVGPTGVRAASAGFFILLAGDLAVMASATNTGAAHPVPVGGGKVDSVMQKKIENDSAAYIRSFVKKRGRNVSLAEKGVLDSVSFTEEEALDGNLIDGIAEDYPDILTKFHGKKIKRFDGVIQELDLKDKELSHFRMSLRQKVLAKVLNPNLAIVIGLIGLLGFYIEFSNPGLIFPGIGGAVCVFVALVAFNLLPINILGVVLIIAAITLFILEAKIASYGALALLGISAMVLGSLILVDTNVPELKITLTTSLGIALPFAIITIFLMRLVLTSYRRKSFTGQEGMIGEIGTTITDLNPDGQVQVHGEIWQAVSKSPINKGNQVKIDAVKNLKVWVSDYLEE